MSKAAVATPLAPAVPLSKEAPVGGCLSIRDVSKVYYADGTSVEALKNWNIEVKAGALVAIVGPSGCGRARY